MTTTDRLTAIKNAAQDARRRVHSARMKLMSEVEPTKILHDLTLAEKDLDATIRACGEEQQAAEVA